MHSPMPVARQPAPRRAPTFRGRDARATARTPSWGILAVVLLIGGTPALPAQERPGKGDVLWALATKAPSYGSAAAGDLDGDGKPEIVFGTYFNDEQVYAVDGATGAVRWRFKSRGGPVDTSILLQDLDGDGRPEVVFGDSAHGTLFCLDAQGKERWTFDGQSGTDSPPAAADLDGDGKIEVVYGTMKTRDGQGRVNALEGASGKLLWSVPVPGHVQSEPALADLDGDQVLDVLVTNWMGDDRLRALSGKDGRELWSFATGDWVYHGASVADLDQDRKPEVVVADRKGSVWMLQGESGKEAWKAALDGEREGSVFGPTTLVDADGKGAPEIAVSGQHLHLLDAQGKLRWRNAYGGRSIARGAAAADADGDGKDDLVFGQGTILRAVRAGDGKELFAYDLRSGEHVHEGIDHAPLVLDLDGDGRFEVFVVEGKGLSDASRPENYGRALVLEVPRSRRASGSPWLTFRGNARRTGIRAP